MTPIVIKIPSDDAKYLALRSFSDPTVVAYGNDPLAVLEEARKAGVKNPFMFTVPKRGQTQIF